ETGFDLFPAFYLVAAGIIGLIGIHFFNETAGRPINGDTPPGSEDEELAEMGYELIGFNENAADEDKETTRSIPHSQLAARPDRGSSCQLRPLPHPPATGDDVYTLLNNAESSKFDLYLPGQLVAALHYKIDEDKNEVMLIYCEAIEPRQPDDHCQELMKRAL